MVLDGCGKKRRWQQQQTTAVVGEERLRVHWARSGASRGVRCSGFFGSQWERHYGRALFYQVDPAPPSECRRALRYPDFLLGLPSGRGQLRAAITCHAAAMTAYLAAAAATAATAASQ